MAEQLPSSQEPQTPGSKWAHEWFPYSEYVNVFTSYMDGLLNEGVVLHDGISFRESKVRNKVIKVRMSGRVRCARGVLAVVDKWLDVRRNAGGHLEVKGESYSYHAYLPASGRQILRYDCHGTHVTQLHKHTYNPKTGAEIDAEPIALNQLPPLDEFIRDAVNRAPEPKSS